MKRNIGQALASGGNTFLQTLVLLNREKEREEDREEDKRWRRVQEAMSRRQMALQEKSEKRAAAADERDAKFDAKQLQQIEMTINGMERSLAAQQRVAEQFGAPDYETFQMLREEEKFALYQQSQQASVEASRAATALSNLNRTWLEKEKPLVLQRLEHEAEVAKFDFDMAKDQYREAQETKDIRKAAGVLGIMQDVVKNLGEQMAGYGHDPLSGKSNAPDDLVARYTEAVDMFGQAKNLELDAALLERFKKIAPEPFKTPEPPAGQSDFFKQYSRSGREAYEQFEREERKAQNPQNMNFAWLDEQNILRMSNDEAEAKAAYNRDPNSLLDPRKVDTSYFGKVYPVDPSSDTLMGYYSLTEEAERRRREQDSLPLYHTPAGR